MLTKKWPSSENDILTAAIKIGSQAFSSGSLKPQFTGKDINHTDIQRYQGAYSVDQNVVLMVHPVSNPAGEYFPLKVSAGTYSAPLIFDDIIETGTTGTLTDVYVFPC